MEKERVGRFIRQMRAQQGMTQKELADRVHVTDKAVSKWERGLAVPSVDLLEPLAKALEVSVLELLDGQRQEKDTIALERANALLQETLERQKKVIFKKRIVLFMLFAILLLCCMISGRLMWNQGLLLDERNLSIVDLYVTGWDCCLDWLRYGLLLAMAGISLAAGLKNN